MHERDAVEGFFGEVIGPQPARGGALSVVEDARPAFSPPLQEEAGRSVRVALDVVEVETLPRERLVNDVPERIRAQARNPRDPDAEARERDPEVRLRSGDSKGELASELGLAFAHRIEESHRLAEGEDGHPSGARRAEG